MDSTRIQEIKSFWELLGLRRCVRYPTEILPAAINNDSNGKLDVQ
jgi:hypothetical protein